MTYTAFDITLAISLGGYIVWSIMKIKELEYICNNYPTPQELAREIVKIKLPMSEVPQELKDQIKEQVFGSNEAPFIVPPKNQKPKDPLPTYLG